MSQRNVEAVVGRLVTDEAFREQFQSDRAAAIDALIVSGLQLTSVERQALIELSCSALKDCADQLDPRLQKISLRRHDP